MPNSDDCLRKLENAKYIFTIDLSKDFWQIPLTREAKLMSAFVTPGGHWQFECMPFGLINATTTCNRLMEKCF